MARTIETRWALRTYDLFCGEVNDVYSQGEINLPLKVTINNPGTAHEFESAYPTDKQIKDVFGLKKSIDVDGDDMHIYVNNNKGIPVGEIECISHISLSPIKTKDDIFSVIEYSSFYAIRHNESGEERTMGDGVDSVFEDDKPIMVGSPGFVRLWEESLNANPDETLEAYFPEMVDYD